MDFVADHPGDGTRFRSLTFVDGNTREALDIVVDQSLLAEQVAEACNRMVAKRGAPVRIFVDNGSKFSRRVSDLCAFCGKATIKFSRLGKPTDN